MPTQDAQLKRSISLTLLTLYGLGTTIGAGIYVIIGAAAGEAGFYLPVAFILASLIAGLSALSFAELSTRFPVSAGEAAYVEAGLGLRSVSFITGAAIATSGAISSATLLQGGVGYIHAVTGGSRTLIFLILLAGVSGLVVWGIAKSLIISAVFTVVEIAGLAIIIAFAPADPISLAAQAIERAPPMDMAIASGVSAAIMLAFFAFIGFEDMVNVVEEVREPKRTMPLAIILTLVITTILYIWIALVAITTLSPAGLSKSAAPLADLFARLFKHGDALLSAVAIAAVLNGAIIQFVMGSRVIYGLARLNQIPKIFAAVHPVTHTPILATGVVALAVTAIGLTFDLKALAAATSSFTLAAFALVNLSLLRIKLRGDPHDGFKVPVTLPALGFVTCAGFLMFETGRQISRSLGL